ncbi:MAG TPA: hypothetical protein VN639_13815 [Azonexus sp.]|nr:hypothetical protein [Azonexus sp.]
MKSRVFLPSYVLALSLCFSTGQACAQAGQPESGAQAAAYPISPAQAGKVLVTFNGLPPEGSYELVGPISVFKRWFGGTGTAMRLLGERARELGANAVVSSSVWLAPAFPAQVAPHGKGIAIRVKDPQVLEALADQASTWE